VFEIFTDAGSRAAGTSPFEQVSKHFGEVWAGTWCRRSPARLTGLTERFLPRASVSSGAGSCAGCGEGTALRMMCSATGSKYGDQWAIVAATGCNTVYGSTYPYNPYSVPWTNSLFENAPAVAMGIRARWDAMGWQKKRLWTIGGDGAMLDIGFQSLSRMLASGMDIKVLVLDTQVYSNTGGQTSTSSFKGQDAKMSFHGKVIKGKSENRKELGNICMMHKDVYVAQTTCSSMRSAERPSTWRVSLGVRAARRTGPARSTASAASASTG